MHERRRQSLQDLRRVTIFPINSQTTQKRRTSCQGTTATRMLSQTATTRSTRKPAHGCRRPSTDSIWDTTNIAVQPSHRPSGTIQGPTGASTARRSATRDDGLNGARSDPPRQFNVSISVGNGPVARIKRASPELALTRSATARPFGRFRKRREEQSSGCKAKR